jgi:hypothetical protein
MALYPVHGQPHGQFPAPIYATLTVAFKAGFAFALWRMLGERRTYVGLQPAARLVSKATCVCKCLRMLDLLESVREVSESPMQAETPNQQAATVPETSEIASAGDSTPVKKQHGGKRSGAGRKPNLVKRLIGRLAPLSAGQILEGIDVEGTIAEIMKKGSLSLKQRTLADLMDRAWGRPAQAVNVSGAVLHAHWTPGKYSHLTDEEFAKLAELSAKALNPTVPETSQNAPQNQIESKPAIEAEIVDSGTIEA